MRDTALTWQSGSSSRDESSLRQHDRPVANSNTRISVPRVIFIWQASTMKDNGEIGEFPSDFNCALFKEMLVTLILSPSLSLSRFHTSLIPSLFGQIGSSSTSTMVSSKMRGTLPDTLDCPLLTALYFLLWISLMRRNLEVNQFVGTIPEVLQSSTHLEVLNVRLFLWSQSVSSLQVGRNQLGGSIPDIFGSWPNLTVLYDLFGLYFNTTAMRNLIHWMVLSRHHCENFRTWKSCARISLSRK